MNAHLDPFADELISSWLARRQRGRPMGPRLTARTHQDPTGRWRHRDIQPERCWLRALGVHFDIDAERLADLAVSHRYRRLTEPFVAWHYFPQSHHVGGGTQLPTLRRAWCSRCLAEDYAAGRPAYVRADWVVAAWSFCPVHRWPLLDRCITCGSGHWRFAKTLRGPPRMFCCNCHRPLERAHPRAIELEPTARPLWDKVIAFEAELRAAMRAKVPDQFRFNNTSARQLLEETSHICLLLARCHARPAMRWLLFDRFTIPAFTLDQYCVGLLPYELPLALADLPLRRCLLAICAAILDKNFDMSEPLEVNSPAPPIDLFTRMAGNVALDRFVSNRKICSQTLEAAVGAARRQLEQRSRVWELRSAVMCLNELFRSAI